MIIIIFACYIVQAVIFNGVHVSLRYVRYSEFTVRELTNLLRFFAPHVKENAVPLNLMGAFECFHYSSGLATRISAGWSLKY